MPQRSFDLEAKDCRSWAREFAGRPEQRVLLNMAREFERLADRPLEQSPRPH